MLLDILSKVYSFISNLGSNTKNLIIIIMFFIISIMAYKDMGDTILDCSAKYNIELKEKAENYSKKMTPIIREHVYHILMNDPNASNVILLSYHNTQTSSQGFSYRYITGLMEEARWDITEPYIDNWRELSAINYGNELDKIHKVGYLRVDSLEGIKDEYPKIYFKLKECNSASAAFYPIHSRSNQVGMIVVLYKESKEYDLGYYLRTIAPCIGELYGILNYLDKQEN